MTHSFSIPVTLSCPNEHQFDALAWRVIDLDEHPDLLPAVLNGTIAVPRCPVCGRGDAIIADSLLLFVSKAERPLIFSPIAALTSDQLKEELDQYVSFISGRFGTEWRDEWNAVSVIQRPRLPNYLDALLNPGTLQHGVHEAVRHHQEYNKTKDLGVLELAISTFERVLTNVAFEEAEATTKFMVYSIAAEEYRERYEKRGDDPDFERATELLEQAARTDDGTYFAQLEEGKGLLLLAAYNRRRAEPMLSDAIQHLEMAQRSLSDDAGDKALILLNCGKAWRKLFVINNEAHSIDRCIDLLREAVAKSPASSTTGVQARNELADALDKRHQRLGDTEDLDEAVRVFDQVIEHATDTTEVSTAFNGRGCVLLDRFCRHGTDEDLEHAIRDLRRSLQPEPTSPGNLAKHWTDLGNALRTRYEVGGDTRNLEYALEAHTRSAEISRTNGLDASVALQSLGIVTMMRYNLSGKLSDLSAAISYLEMAVEETPVASQHEAGGKVALGNSLCQRYRLTGMEQDLQRAIKALEEALAAKIVPEPLRPSALEGLGSSLTLEYRRTGAAPVLDRAIEVLDQAGNSPMASEMMLPSILVTQAAALSSRYSISKRPDDIERATDLLRRSVSRLPADSPRRQVNLGQLAQTLQLRAEFGSDESSRAEAVDLYEEVTRASAAPSDILDNGARWAGMEFRQGNWPVAVEAFQRALRARDDLLVIQTLRSEKSAWLGEAQGLAADGAFAFAKNGNIDLAVTTLEQGLAILLSEALGRSNQEGDRLRQAGHSQLADEYAEAALRWRAASRLSLLAGLPLSDDEIARQMEDARANFDRLLLKIRDESGFEEFQKPLSIGDIKKIAAEFDGPIVYLATTYHGSLAVIVIGNETRALWPKLTTTQLAELLVEEDNGQVSGGYLLAQHNVLGALDDCLSDTLPLLGRDLMAPVRDELQKLGCEKVALVLTGWLSLLPASAGCDGGGSLMDCFSVHLQPNAHSLRTGLVEARRRGDNSKALVIGNPMPSLRPLLAAEIEANIVASHFPEATIMTGASVEKAKVLRLLPESSYVHFACHGFSAPQNALSSALSLGGKEELSVSDLLFGTSIPERARLVVLSACQSAIVDFSRLPDETVGLPVSFLEAGVPGVVGTLWSVEDFSTALLMDRFYQLHLREGMSPGSALRAAQEWLRTLSASILAQHFKKECEKSDSERNAPYETVSAEWRRFTLLDPEVFPFGSPVYWAAFVFYGV